MRIASGGWRRAGVVLGFLFAVLAVMIGFGLEHITSDAAGNQALPGGSTGAALARYITAHQGEFNTALILQGLVVVLLLFFIASLHEHLSRSGRPMSPFGQLMLGSSFLTASILLVGQIASIAMVDVTPRDDTQSIRALWQFSFAMEATVSLGFGLLFIAVGAAIWRTKALPVWLAAFSIVLGSAEWVTGAAAGGPGPIGPAVWAIVVSGTMLVERRRPARAQDRTEKLASQTV